MPDHEEYSLLGVVETAASGHQRAAGQVFVECRVLATVELVDRNLPNWEGLRRTLAAVAGTFVRDPEKERLLYGKENRL